MAEDSRTRSISILDEQQKFLCNSVELKQKSNVGQEIDNDVVFNYSKNQNNQTKDALYSKRRYSVFESLNKDTRTATKQISHIQDPSFDFGLNKKVWDVYLMMTKDETALESGGDFDDNFLYIILGAALAT